MVAIAADLFAQKGYRATTVREIADAAGILSGSLYHHFDSKESIGDEILSGFINEVLANYRAAVAEAADPRAVLEQIVRSTSLTLSSHRAALTMLQNDWNHFAAQPRFAYLPKALREIERTWIGQLELGRQAGLFRTDLDPEAHLPPAPGRAVDSRAVAPDPRLQRRPGGRRLPAHPLRRDRRPRARRHDRLICSCRCPRSWLLPSHQASVWSTEGRPGGTMGRPTVRSR